MNEDIGQFDLTTMPLARLVSYAGTVITQRWARVMAEADYDPSEITVLFALVDDEDLSQREIARRVQLSASRVTSIVDALEARGLLERIRDRRDRRVARLRITEAGEKYRAGARQLVRERFSELVPAVDREDEDVIRGYLLRLISALGREHDR